MAQKAFFHQTFSSSFHALLHLNSVYFFTNMLARYYTTSGLLFFSFQVTGPALKSLKGKPK
jgi:hypothetical protein